MYLLGVKIKIKKRYKDVILRVLLQWQAVVPQKVQFWSLIFLCVLTLMLFQTCMSFFLMLNIKEDILKNAGKQTADGPHWLP